LECWRQPAGHQCLAWLQVVKLWDTRGNAPALVTSQDLQVNAAVCCMLHRAHSGVAFQTCSMQVGAVFSMGFSPDAPALLAAGGAEGGVTVWDVRASQQVMESWPGLAAQQA
jgi:WD40 repeat protein